MFHYELSDCGFESLTVIYFITLFNLGQCFHLIVLVLLYSSKQHSTLFLELRETQILKTCYCYKKWIEKKNTNLLSIVHTELLRQT